ncbi:hypothetical protein [Terrisporobacter glycolicus]|uniref:Uncharacterized protein n=1 Tax=Terrisporobacter glycolicus ATCC 14880 = DSM 1288 TaxID=1121315 RepID=A0ABZ2EUB7_9FIRM|nr:hypothetical protein [Terrisporobacter glycolicus]
MKKGNKKAIIPIVLYVVAALIAVYSIFTIYTSYTYISSLVAAGSIVIKDQMAQVISYYITTSMPYVFYAIVVWAIGYIINKLNNLSPSTINKENVKSEEEKID